MKKSTKTNDTPEYSVDDRVIIFGGVVDTNGVIESNIQTAKVIQVGEKDLLVSINNFSTYDVVPKQICIPLRSDPTGLSAPPLKPQIGDMVYFKGKEQWRDKEETTIVGVVYEIAYAGGRPTSVKIHSAGEMKVLDYRSLLVLQRNSEKI